MAAAKAASIALEHGSDDENRVFVVHEGIQSAEILIGQQDFPLAHDLVQHEVHLLLRLRALQADVDVSERQDLPGKGIEQEN